MECSWKMKWLGLGSKEEWQACVRRSCEQGQVEQDGESAYAPEACTRWRAEKTGIAHVIKRTFIHHMDSSQFRYEMIPCPLDKVYDGWLGQNDTYARTCAEAWNALAKEKDSPIRYEAKRIASRRVFSDIWQVVVKK